MNFLFSPAPGPTGTLPSSVLERWLCSHCGADNSTRTTVCARCRRDRMEVKRV